MGDRATTYSRDSVLKVGDVIVLNVSLNAFDMTTYSVMSPTAPTQPARDNVMITVQSVGTGEQDEGDHLSVGGIVGIILWNMVKYSTYLEDLVDRSRFD